MTQQMIRVAESIAPRIMDFAVSRLGQEFRMAELLTYVRLMFPKIAPDSPSRILRALRKAGTVDYTVLNRAASLYRVNRVKVAA